MILVVVAIIWKRDSEREKQKMRVQEEDSNRKRKIVGVYMAKSASHHAVDSNKLFYAVVFLLFLGWVYWILSPQSIKDENDWTTAIIGAVFFGYVFYALFIAKSRIEVTDQGLVNGKTLYAWDKIQELLDYGGFVVLKYTNSEGKTQELGLDFRNKHVEFLKSVRRYHDVESP